MVVRNFIKTLDLTNKQLSEVERCIEIVLDKDDLDQEFREDLKDIQKIIYDTWYPRNYA